MRAYFAPVAPASAIVPPPVAMVVATISAAPAHVKANISTPTRLRRAQISPAEIIPPRRDVSMIAMARISISSVEYDSGASAVLPIVAENGGDFRDYCAKLGDHRERVTITGSGS